MIELIDGNILYVDVEAVVNPVNCVGVMGRGLALQFKEMFPENFEAYATACVRGEVRPGQVFVFKRDPPENPQYIINFPTKRHWRDRSLIEDIDAGLADLVNVLRYWDIRSIAIPPLGCGLGGLDWVKVRPRIELAMERIPHVYVLLSESGQRVAQ
ncbi:macro domain-containing protein [Paraburkholderia adhaesiva]|uniref:macro domain-containing protein n=1 Tax=Paraburkholderia adhaesiva TaxID=2883244 RepID=UPI001F1E2692|nr:macro domain-containing protein [Paraburkholderia adhaesiva]